MKNIIPLIFMLALCGGLFIACSDSGSDKSKAAGLLLLNGQQQEKMLIEIPKGVAE